VGIKGADVGTGIPSNSSKELAKHLEDTGSLGASCQKQQCSEDEEGGKPRYNRKGKTWI
jgi:hypothetical protein